MHELMCFIPARGGSKGIVNKNLKMLNNIPLVAHSIEHAIKDLPFIDKNIVLSSDSDDILFVGESYGITCLKRPSNISGDFSTTEEAMLHAIKEFPAENIMLLQPTSPFRFKGRLLECWNRFVNKGYDSMFTAQKLYDFFWSLDNNDDWQASYDVQNRPMRQSLTKQQYKYFDNGNLYLTKTQILQNEKSRIGGKIGVFPITEFESMQIDSEADFLIFESIVRNSINTLSTGDIHEISNSGCRNRKHTHRQNE